MTVPRMCWATAVYDLAWGVMMLALGPALLTPELGSAFAPAVLADNPVLGSWIRLLGTTLVGLAVVCVALAQIRDHQAQVWIRRAWLAYWIIEVVVDGLCLQLPALLAGDPQATALGVGVPLVFRTAFVLGWALASCSPSSELEVAQGRTKL